MTRDELFQRVALVLDEPSAKKLERDMERAMRRSARAMVAPRDEMGKFVKVNEEAARKVERRWGARGVFGGIRRSILSLQGAMAGMGVTLAGGALLQVNREAQSLQAQLKVAEGGAEAAMERFAAIEEFATTTPFQLGEVTQAYLDLKTAGVSATEAMMIAFGDVASARGKNIRDFTMAVQDALTGEMERLKEFGIVSQQQGDKVTFTFNGQTQTVERTREAVLAYLQSVGEMEGVQGSMAEQMVTLNGIISNLWDNIGALGRIIGEEGFTKAASTAGKETVSWTEKLNQNRDTIGAWTRGIIGVVRVLGVLLVGAIRLVTNMLSVAWRSIDLFVTGIFTGTLEVQNSFSRMVNWIIEQLNRIPGVQIDTRAAIANLDGLRDRIAGLKEGIVKDNADIGDAVTDLWSTAADSWRHFQTGGTTDAQRNISSEFGGGEIIGGGSAIGGTGAAGGDGDDPTWWDRDRRGELSQTRMRDLRQLSMRQNELPRLILPIVPRLPDEDLVDSAMSYLRDSAWSTAQTMTDAFAGFFESFEAGIKGDIGMLEALGKAAAGVGKAIVSSLAEGWAGFAMARGTAALAEGTWPPNPAALFSATKWFAAAGLFRALGSKLSGGGGGGGVSTRDAGIDQTRDRIGQPPVVNIYIDPLDPSRPAYQKNVAIAGRLGQELIGRGDAKINVRPTNG